MKRAFTLIEVIIALVMLLVVLVVGSVLVVSLTYGPDAYSKLVDKNVNGTSMPESAWNEMKKAVVARLPSDMGATFKDPTNGTVKKIESLQNDDKWIVQNGEIELQSLLDPKAQPERRTYSCIVERKNNSITVDHLKIDDATETKPPEPPKPAAKK